MRQGLLKSFFEGRMTEPEDRLRDMLDAAEEIPPLEPDTDPDGDGDRGGGDDDGEPRRSNELPEDSPVIPLGKMGDICAYLDELGQYVELKARDHNRLNLQSLFGRKFDPFVTDHWPRITIVKDAHGNKEPVVTGWRPELVAEALMVRAADRGVWSPHDKVRGAGAWLSNGSDGGEGDLVLHLGDKLLVIAKLENAERPATALPWVEQEPGLVGSMVYPTAAALHGPAIEPAPAAPDKKNPGQRLLNLFRTWQWQRPEIDPELMLGLACAAMLGGALKVRPLLWLTGGYGTGKSSLQQAIKWLFGPGGMLTTSDPSAAAIRQILKHASLPVGLDEAEATEDNSRMNALVKLARDAATGSLTIRGGSNHEAVTFTVRSCFLFSSILIPPLLPQDRSRMAILNLQPLDKSAAPPRITERGMAKLGAQLLRRLVDQWPRAEATIDAYRDAMRKLGLDSRGQDVYGTLLAMKDLALYDELPVEDMLHGIAERLRPWLLAELDSNDADSQSCLNHLLTYAIDSGGDSRQLQPIGWWICRASGYAVPDADGTGGETPTMEQSKAANRVLGRLGVAVVRKEAMPHTLASGAIATRSGQYIAIHNKHTGLLRVFAGTQWAGRPGADGVWKQSLQRLAQHRKLINHLQWIGGVTQRATLLPIELAWPSHNPSAAAEEPAAPQDGAGEYPHVQAQAAPERPAADTASASPDQADDISGEGAGDPAPSAFDDEDEVF
jgi:hypothetical protein